MSLQKPPLLRILLNNVSCMRNLQQILRHVNVTAHDGVALVLTGTNGSGKSTFLCMLAGFSRPSAGEIPWNGHDITNSGVYHQYKLQLNWLSLKDAIKDKLTALGKVQWFEVLEGKQGKLLPALELMGLERLAKEKARMLSMGQRKGLQLATLLAIDRPIWLLWTMKGIIPNIFHRMKPADANPMLSMIIKTRERIMPGTPSRAKLMTR
ncbi:ABC transporter-like, ATP-binding domain [Dillenia turbinata]|uniref:ABC transporter-like, ATP-binding domain n=1 Tax=Dillenia turbinata TaxID=194707 RepID=A0AAN8ZLI0_9MAGN